MHHKSIRIRANLSPSMRRAWIEIPVIEAVKKMNPVALHAEGVDRNKSKVFETENIHVALHAEGVDRNSTIRPSVSAPIVALHAEGVDRNVDDDGKPLEWEMSPSMRRAWIEIMTVIMVAAQVVGRPPCGGRG